jgi:hypothetical protein
MMAKRDKPLSVHYSLTVIPLVIQLLLAVNRSEGLRWCSGCGMPFLSVATVFQGPRGQIDRKTKLLSKPSSVARAPKRDAVPDYRKLKARSSLPHFG